MADYQNRFRIGKRNTKGRLEHAFYIERRQDGGIRLTKVSSDLSSRDRHLLFTHFGRPQEGVTGEYDEDKGVTYTITNKSKPGDPEHFMRACHAIPAPFSIMADNYEKYLR